MSLTGVEESLRLLDEWAKDKNRRKLERARAEGFTSVEAYTRHLTEEREQQDIANEEYIREQCKATGQTREEYDTELFRGNIKSPVSFLPPRVDCDCKEHPFDPFCPESLVLYQSQDLPDLMTFLNNQHPVRLDQVKIEEGQKSRRLDQEMLEKSWTRNISQQAPMRVPFWANADPVVQSILRQDICWNASPSPSQPPSSIPILLHGEPATISPTTARTSMSTRAESQSHAPYLAAAIPSDSPPSDAADVNRDKRKSKGNAGRRTTTNPKAPKEVAGRRLKRDSRIAKRSWRPAMGLRSRTSQNFAS